MHGLETIKKLNDREVEAVSVKNDEIHDAILMIWTSAELFPGTANYEVDEDLLNNLFKAVGLYVGRKGA
jgi:hypothetical protein